MSTGISVGCCAFLGRVGFVSNYLQHYILNKWKACYAMRLSSIVFAEVVDTGLQSVKLQGDNHGNIQ